MRDIDSVHGVHDRRMIRASKHTNRKPTPCALYFYRSREQHGLTHFYWLRSGSTSRTSIQFRNTGDNRGYLSRGESRSSRETRARRVCKHEEEHRIHLGSIYLLCSTHARSCAYKEGLRESREACLRYRRGVGAGAARAHRYGHSQFISTSAANMCTYARTHARVRTLASSRARSRS